MAKVPRDHQFQCFLSREEERLLRMIAELDDRTMSASVRVLIREEAKRRGIARPRAVEERPTGS